MVIADLSDYEKFLVGYLWRNRASRKGPTTRDLRRAEDRQKINQYMDDIRTSRDTVGQKTRRAKAIEYIRHYLVVPMISKL